MATLNKIEKLAQIAPILACGISADEFKNALVLPASIPSKKLGIINTKTGLNAPKWFVDIVKKDLDTIVIEGIDTIDMEEQEKFYELLKYQTISSVEFHKPLKIIVAYSDIKKVSPTVTSLCQIVK